MDLKRNGVDTISFSIDSHDLSEHDIFRKKRGAAQRAWEMLFFAQRHGVRVNISTTVSHQNIDSHGLTELIKYTRKISAGLVLVPAVPMGRWAKNAAVCLTGRDFQKIEKYVRENRHVMTDYEYNYHHRGCGAVKEILYVSPYGDILPCPFIPFSLGNVQEESLACIRERALHLKCFNTYEKNCLAARNPGFVRKLSK
jgi:MoaA/NifB/PqqE/SkfB family radical SAM enzyme